VTAPADPDGATWAAAGDDLDPLRQPPADLGERLRLLEQVEVEVRTRLAQLDRR
jgi:hypothetical protein